MVRTFKSEYYDLPTKYDKTEIKLLVQSPTRMYAYWDYSDKDIQAFSEEKVQSVSFLRITNLTKQYSYDIPVDYYTNNYYIETTDSDCDYKVELIRKKFDNSFMVSSSNTTHIPRSSPCEYNEDIIFRNCICLAITDKFKIYTQNRNNLKKYTDLSFDDSADSISSMNNLQK